MKTDNRNWILKGIICISLAGAVLSIVLVPAIGCTSLISNPLLRAFLTVVLTVVFMIFAGMAGWGCMTYESDDNRLSRGE